MTIEDFLKLPNPEMYDFTNDGANIKYQSITDPIEKYFIYKAVNETGWKNEKYQTGLEFSKNCKKEINYGSICDPDSHSLLLQLIYKQLWCGSSLVESIDPCVKISGDTLNSCQTTLNKTIQRIEQDEKSFNCLNDIYPKMCGKYYSKKYAITLFAADMKPSTNKLFCNKLKSVNFLCHFLECYHTLGNFMPVPYGCNAPRGIGSTNDYWDLALKIIYDYYVNDGDGISDIVGCDYTLIQRYKEWLDSFASEGNKSQGWKNFIEINFLQDFVNCSDSCYGPPIELWPEKSSLREDEINLKKDEIFYKRATCVILKRSKRMVAELKNK